MKKDFTWLFVGHFLAMAVILSGQSLKPESIDPDLFSMDNLADPADGVELIQAPVGNAQGSAHLDFPLTLPPGRKDMAPDLTISYDSENQNGWLGWGWDLMIPAIEIDTRWGVPRFNNDLETESYLLSGEQLTPLAHRNAAQPRSVEKIFHSRVETDFLRIIRHGGQPSNYWWEVWDVEGNIYVYGRPGDGSSLTDDQGLIVRWALQEIRDPDGNSIDFKYITVADPGLVDGSVPGKYLYPDVITYTGFEDQEGPFEVRFIRDRQLGEVSRKDKMIGCRLGFKEVCGDLLRRIDISYQGDLVRSYRLNYQTGAFGKTLLQAIAQYDGHDQLFYQHQFTYYDDVASDQDRMRYLSAASWDVPYDQVRGKIVNPIPGFDGEVSVLGGDASNNTGGSTVVTVGPLGDPTSKLNSAGGSFAYASSESRGLLALVDINGDGLPDKVFQKNGSLYYRANQIHQHLGFGPERMVKGITNFSLTKASSTSIGAEGHVGPVFGGYEHTTTSSRATTYFSDFNGDELIDVAHNGVVYFNHINADGDPEFTRSSSPTPNPINPTSPPDPDLFVQDPLELAKKINDFPLHDVVKMWQAPDTGVINIQAPVQLLEDPTALEYMHNDGVRVTIQLRGQELWSTRIEGNDYSIKQPANVSLRSVNKGDRIYFRVQSVFDGAYDRVHWDPVISYFSVSGDTLTANARSRMTYRSSEDFLVTGLQSLHLPMNGQLHIEGQLDKKPLTDDINVQILKVRNTDTTYILDQSFSWQDSLSTNLILDNVTVTDADLLYFRVVSATQIDWTDLAWQPRIYYTQADGQEVTSPDGRPLFEFFPVVDFSMFNDPVRSTDIWVAPGNGDVQVSLDIPRIADTLQGTLTLSVKSLKALVARRSLHFINGTAPQTLSLIAPVQSGDSLWIEVHATNPVVGYQLQNVNTVLQMGGVSRIFENGLFTTSRNEQALFGPLYRGWGQFAYYGNGNRANQPIVESDLKLDDNMMHVDTADIDLEDPESLGDLFNAKEAALIILVPDVETQGWLGYDNLTYVLADVISSSRLGEDDLSLTPPGNNGEGLAAPARMFTNTMHSVAVGGGAGVISGSAGTSWSETETLLDLQDMNGDRYPDIVTKDQIQYSTVQGGWEAKSVAYDLGSHLAKSNAVGANLGGGFIYSSTSNSGEAAGGISRASRAKAQTGKSSKRARSAAKTAAEAIGISGNFTTDDDHAEHSWEDMNGDGLVDKVFRNGRVALNLGYRFAAAEPWGFSEIRAGNSTDYGAGIGVNYMNGSIVAGTSLSRTDITTHSGLEDLNGDGLPDWVVSTDPMRVRLNTGSGFGPETTWDGMLSLETSSATGESVNSAFTACIEIVFIGIRICVNPGFFTGQGASRGKTLLTDINGDGYPDFLQAETNDGDLKVAPSSIGRTNRLKSVENPLGGTIIMDYALAGNTYDMPFGQWVLSKVDQIDGITGDGQDTIRTRYLYTNGHYDRRERMFYGFGQVEQQDWERDSLYRLIRSTYDVSTYYRKGLKKSELLLDSDLKPYLKSDYVYELRFPDTGLVVPDTQKDDETASYFPALVSEQTYFYEGESTPGLQHRVDYDYDTHGNLILSRDYGNGQAEDVLTTRTSYYTLEAQNIYSVPKEIILSDHNGWMRRRTIEVDDAGNITETQDHLSGDSIAVNSYLFDEYGNLIGASHPNNLHGDRLTFTYTWDEELHTYLEAVEDGYGYRTHYEYDPRFGTMVKETGINGESVTYTFDENGRMETMVSPYEIAADRPYTQAYAYHLEAPVPYAETRSFDSTHDRDIMAYQFLDGLGRVIQTKRQLSLFQGEDQPDEEVLQVSGKKDYDGQGRVIAEYYPITETFNQAVQLNKQTATISPVRFSYDVMDRIVEQVRPDGSSMRIRYDIAADDRMQPSIHTVTTDALGNRRHTYWDVRERQVASMDETDEGEIWTSFIYNALSELVVTKDDQSLETNYRYDHLGRQIQTASPDGGLIVNTYDLANNLITRTTSSIRQNIPDGGTIRYDYEKERLIHISYPKNIQNDVFYHYGEPEAPYHRAGRIWLTEDASGGQEWMFGPLGEITKEIRTLLINTTRISTFISAGTWDSWGRNLSFQYPDGETVKYRYNAGGLPDGMTGEKLGRHYDYLPQVGYDEFGDKTYLKYGNGTHQTIHFSPDRRQIKQLSAGRGQQLFMDQQFSYDKESNVTQLIDRVMPEDPSLQGTYTVGYTYDRLHRLTQASGDVLGNQTYAFDLDMGYEHTANVREKKQMIMTGGKLNEDRSVDWSFDYNGRHSPQRINDKQMIYDVNGNLTDQSSLTAFDNRQMIWDEEDRLMGVSDNGQISRYTYDAGGHRILKSQGGSQGIFLDGESAGFVNHTDDYTAYESPYLTVKKDRFYKHYFLDGERFLSKRGTGKFVSDLLPTYRGLTAGNIDYQARLRALQQGLDQYYHDLGVPPGPPTLYGYYANPDVTGVPFPQGQAGQPVNLPPASWNLPIGPPDTTGPPGPPVWINAANTALAEPGYGFTGDQLSPEILDYYYLGDPLGNITYVTNHAGDVIRHVSYLPFGEVLFDNNKDGEIPNYLFGGKELDEETNLYYFGARYFDPRMSMWQSADPEAGAYPSLSPYAFVANNPLKYADPDGNLIVVPVHSSYAFKLDVRRAMRYLRRSPTGTKLLNTLQSSSRLIMIEETKDLKGVKFDPDQMVVTWHPRSALRVKRGAKQTAALGLAHELGHAEKRLRNPVEEEKDFNHDLYNSYDNLAEKKIIRGVEYRIAKELNEPTRTDHGGSAYLATSPTSTQSVKNRNQRKARKPLQPRRPYRGGTPKASASKKKSNRAFTYKPNN
ncbi:MAG: SpvB/TcaC N-terminal domain-containing protein [Saprospiraceae bacterium]